MKTLLAGGLILISSWGAYASDCSTTKEMDTADAVASKIHDWTGVNSFYGNFRQCDDGYIAEGMSDTIVNLLAHKWGDTGQLRKITDQDKNFEAWMLNHIDSTVNGDDLDLIIKNTKNECSADSSQLCGKIEDAAKQAIQEMNEQ